MVEEGAKLAGAAAWLVYLAVTRDGAGSSEDLVS